jgi:hypothetical protein
MNGDVSLIQMAYYPLDDRHLIPGVDKIFCSSPLWPDRIKTALFSIVATANSFCGSKGAGA